MKNKYNVFIFTALILLSYSSLNSAWYGPWINRRMISNNFACTGDLTNFPLLVHISNDSGIKTQVSNNGYNILFTDITGTNKLDHEIEYVNTNDGEIFAWVRIPVLSASAADSNVIYMYYDKYKTENYQNKTGVWNNDYRGVWHLHDYNDSTIHGNNGTPRAANSATSNSADAIIYKSTYFCGQSNTDSGIAFGLNACPGNPEAQTVSLWIKTPNPGHTVMYLSKIDYNDDGEYHAIRNDNRMQVTKSTNVSTSSVTSPVGYITYDTWINLAIVMDLQNIEWYTNGIFVGTTALGNGWLSNISQTMILGDYYGSGWYELSNAYIDEYRHSYVKHSANWIKTSYSNQRFFDDFRTVFPLETNTNNYKVCGFISGLVSNNIMLVFSGNTNYTNYSSAGGYYEIMLRTGGIYTVQPQSNSLVFNPSSYTFSIESNINSNYNFTAAPGNSISGYIKNLSGSCLAGIAVSISGAFNLSTNSDPEGYYVFNVTSGVYTLTVNQGAYYARNSLTREVTVSGADCTGNNFILEDYYTVSGIVREQVNNTASKTASGVWVVSGGDAVMSNKTGTNGSYSLAVPAGSYVLSPVSSGYRSSPYNTTVTLINTNLYNIDFNIFPEVCIISGYILDQELNPYAGIKVILDNNFDYTAESDTRGYYSFTANIGGHSIALDSGSLPFKHTTTNFSVNSALVSNINFYINFPGIMKEGGEISFSRERIFAAGNNSTADIGFYKSSAGQHNCKIILADLGGRVIKKIFEGCLNRGIYYYPVPGIAGLKTGIYFVQIEMETGPGEAKKRYSKIITVLK